jgi:hypothetical protein
MVWLQVYHYVYRSHTRCQRRICDHEGLYIEFGSVGEHEFKGQQPHTPKNVM